MCVLTFALLKLWLVLTDVDATDPQHPFPFYHLAMCSWVDELDGWMSGRHAGGLTNPTVHSAMFHRVLFAQSSGAFICRMFTSSVDNNVAHLNERNEFSVAEGLSATVFRAILVRASNYHTSAA